LPVGGCVGCGDGVTTGGGCVTVGGGGVPMGGLMGEALWKELKKAKLTDVRAIS
jgi:hypothetical protein